MEENSGIRTGSPDRKDWRGSRVQL